MAICKVCGALPGQRHGFGCADNMRQSDESSDVFGFRPPVGSVLISAEDPIMRMGQELSPTNDEDIFDRPTMDPDEHP
jgi:hypothetical protein